MTIYNLMPDCNFQNSLGSPVSVVQYSKYLRGAIKHLGPGTVELCEVISKMKTHLLAARGRDICS
jgi:hypothetical protein